MCEEVRLDQIEALREQLLLFANEKGYTHKKTIAVSQKLDKLLNAYSRKLNDKSMPNEIHNSK